MEKNVFFVSFDFKLYLFQEYKEREGVVCSYFNYSYKLMPYD